MEIVRSVPLVEEILDAHSHRAGGDESGWAAYRAHVYRVINFARALGPDHPDRDDKLAIAAAFHDLAVFDTLDYLVPSIAVQDDWLQRTGRQDWSTELAVAVAVPGGAPGAAGSTGPGLPNLCRRSSLPIGEGGVFHLCRSA